MDEEEDVLFQDFLHKLKLPKSGKFNRLAQGRWKTKYFVLSCFRNRLVLKYYNKKPKQLSSGQPKQQINLCPSFKVEKLRNAHSRAFAMELTAPAHQLCLSADDQSTLDKLVFLLQTQVKLRDTITDNLIEVKTDPSEVFSRIGVKEMKCLLHVSPWGLTLVFRQSRAVVAQWPLKSVRYYQSTGQGQFSIEAGMVAPMGEGVFHFWMAPGLDNRLYDTVDRYVISTLDRVKPNQRGTEEEIHDYIREFDCLHSLTVLTPTPLAANEEVSRALRDNWECEDGGFGDHRSESASLQRAPGTSVRSPTLESSSSSVHQAESRSPSTSSTSSPRLVSNNTNRPLPSPRSDQHRHSPRQAGARGSPAEDRRVSGRPPPPPPRPGPAGSARLTRGSPRLPRAEGGDNTTQGLPGTAVSPPGTDSQPRRHSNPSSVALRVTHCQTPSVRKQFSYDSEASGWTENTLRYDPDSPRSPSSPQGSAGRSSCPVPADSPQGPGVGGQKLDMPVEDWLVSASCEDLSDHMRAVIFQQRRSKELKVSSLAAAAQDQKQNNNDAEFIPPPFTNIVDFRSSVEWDRSQAQARDRSQSFDVNAKMHRKGPVRNGAASGSSSPSIKQIRKMVSARSATKENLRKSLSNPNYLNLGSKEKLSQHRVQSSKHAAQDKGDTLKLSAQQKQKSRSLASLLPSSLRRYISRESLSHPSSSSPSPDVRHSRQRNGHVARHDNDSGNFRRQYSGGSLREMSIKGIHFTERSRSFRKPKDYQRSKSAEPHHRTPLDDEMTLDDSDRPDKYARSQSTPERDSQGAESTQDSENLGTDVDSDLCARNTAANRERPLPPEPVWKLRLPSRSTSQSSC